jgi:hypothetical protein
MPAGPSTNCFRWRRSGFGVRIPDGRDATLAPRSLSMSRLCARGNPHADAWDDGSPRQGAPGRRLGHWHTTAPTVPRRADSRGGLATDGRHVALKRMTQFCEMVSIRPIVLALPAAASPESSSTVVRATSVMTSSIPPQHSYRPNRRNTTAFRPWIRAVTQCHVPPTSTGLDIPPFSNPTFTIKASINDYTGV